MRERVVMGRLFAAIGKSLEEIAVLWGTLSLPRKMFLLVSALLVFAGIWAFRWYMAERAYRPLYNGLTDQEAGIAAARLRELQVPYKLAAGGSTILVPEPRLAEVRLQLAADGLPQQGRLGFELFDRSSFGATEFAEQVNFRRALEGELERSVLSLKEVERARVHISLPKRSVFLDFEQPAKASVVVQLRRNARLDNEQVNAIAYLVASAAEGLEPQRVVIVDTNGNVLAQPRQGGEEFTGQQLEHQRSIEREIRRKILETLEPYVGLDKVRASVAAECDWNSGEQTEELIDPNAVVMTTQKSEERSEPVAESGVPGTASNLPRESVRPQVAGTGLSRTMETTNYQTSRTVTRMELERGAIKRLSVAVLVDHKSEWDESAEELLRTPRTAEEMETIRQLTIAAAGIMEERGDLLTLESLPFTTLEPLPLQPAAPLGPPEQIWSLEWLKKHRYELIGAGLLLLLALVTLTWLAGMKRKLAAAGVEQQAALAAEQAKRELDEAEQQRLQREAEEARLLKGLKIDSLQSPKAQALKKHLEETVQKDPQGFAQLIRSWMQEK